MTTPRSEIRLTPPPRATSPGPAEAAAPRSTPREHARTFGSRELSRRLTTSAFALLGAAALAVFFVLPRWVEQRRVGQATEAVGLAAQEDDADVRIEVHGGPPSSPSSAGRIGISDSAAALQPDATTPPLLEAVARSRRALREQAYIRQQAEAAVARASEWQQQLEARTVDLWAADAYAVASALVTSGDERLQARDYAGGLENLEAAIGRFETINTSAESIVADALADARRALDAGDSVAAAAAFQMAATVHPGNKEALTGLQRAEVLDQVIELMTAGADREQSGDLRGAASFYRQALELDPQSEAGGAFSRVNIRIKEWAFGAAMSDGLKALERSDFDAARVAFERADSIKPGSEQSAAGLTRAESGRRNAQITTHRERGRDLEQQELWKSAATEYRHALRLDNSLKFAQEGLDRTSQRAELADQLDYHLNNVHRLNDEEVYAEAETMLVRARAADGAGPKLRQQIERLSQALAIASMPIRVDFRSDGLTEVTIYRIGRLGTFDRHSLELKPGTYTVVGSRRGYRDVRHELTVVPGTIAEPLLIRCDEEI